MSQHDFNIDNQSAPAFRSDLNNALEALGTLSSGATAPSTTFANMIWYDTAANILKMRSENDDAWINVGYLCQSTNKFCILDDTNVVTTGGTQAGLLGDQATSAWEAGTSTTESLVSPAKVKAAIDALFPSVSYNSGWIGSFSLPFTQSHGLGETPLRYEFQVRTKAAYVGFPSGAVISINPQQDGDSNRRHTSYADATNVYLGSGVRLASPDGTLTAVDDTNYEIRVLVWVE